MNKVDLGPYASRIFKFTLFNEGNYMENPLKFIHINKDSLLQSGLLSQAQRKKNRSRTVAVLALSPHAVQHVVSDYASTSKGSFVTVRMAVGISLVSLNDNYSKSVGRDEAVKQMKEVDIKVKAVTMNDTHTTVVLEEHESVRLVLKVNRQTGFSTVYGDMSASLD